MEATDGGERQGIYVVGGAVCPSVRLSVRTVGEKKKEEKRKKERKKKQEMRDGGRGTWDSANGSSGDNDTQFQGEGPGEAGAFANVVCGPWWKWRWRSFGLSTGTRDDAKTPQRGLGF